MLWRIVLWEPDVRIGVGMDAVQEEGSGASAQQLAPEEA